MSNEKTENASKNSGRQLDERPTLLEQEMEKLHTELRAAGFTVVKKEPDR